MASYEPQQIREHYEHQVRFSAFPCIWPSKASSKGSLRVSTGRTAAGCCLKTSAEATHDSVPPLRIERFHALLTCASCFVRIWHFSFEREKEQGSEGTRDMA